MMPAVATGEQDNEEIVPAGKETTPIWCRAISAEVEGPGPAARVERDQLSRSMKCAFWITPCTPTVRSTTWEISKFAAADR